MSGWNLPPGVTQRDIDDAMGDDGICEVCGHTFPDGELGWARVRGCAKVWCCGSCAPDPDRLREDQEDRDRFDEDYNDGAFD